MTVPSRRKDSKAARVAAVLLGLALLVGLGFVVAPRSKTAPEPAPAPEKPVDTSPPVAQRPATPGAAPRVPRPRVKLPDGGYEEPFDPQDTPVTPPARPGRFPYPPGSLPLVQGTSPSAQPPEDDTIDPKTGDHVVFGPRFAFVHPDDPLVIDLQLLNKLNANMPVADGVARFRPDGSDVDKGPWFTVALVDDGSGADLAAGDLHYTATFQPDAAQKAALLRGGTHVFVDVGFSPPNGNGLRRFSTVMEYSREPDATLSGKYTDAFDRGSLVIDAGVTVTAAGQFRVVGSLYGAGQAIGFASNTATLGVGEGSIPLLFFGKILHDKGIDGPYELRFVLLTQHLPDGNDLPGDTVDPAYTTQSYSARAFSDAAYAPPADTYAKVDNSDPSQQDKPPPVISAAENAKLLNEPPPINADPANGRQHPTVPVSTK